MTRDVSLCSAKPHEGLARPYLQSATSGLPWLGAPGRCASNAAKRCAVPHRRDAQAQANSWCESAPSRDSAASALRSVRQQRPHVKQHFKYDRPANGAMCLLKNVVLYARRYRERPRARPASQRLVQTCTPSSGCIK